MSRFICLSHVFEDSMPIFPGDRSVSLVHSRTVEKDGFNAYELKTGLHAGTHLDAPLHFLTVGQMVKDLALETFMGRGCLLDVRGEAVIRYKEDYDKAVLPGDIVLLWTGYSTIYGTEGYYTNHPVVGEELADFLIRRGIKMLGVDLPSPDQPPFAVHKRLFMANIPLLENLTNLEALAGFGEFEVMAFPLKISAEASPVRVVARNAVAKVDT